MLAPELSPRTKTSPLRTAETRLTITRLLSVGSLRAIRFPALTEPVRTTSNRSPTDRVGSMLIPATTTRRGLERPAAPSNNNPMTITALRVTPGPRRSVGRGSRAPHPGYGGWRTAGARDPHEGDT